jgi:hypothetical protein
MPSETISKKISAKAVSKVQKSELKNSTDNEIKKLIKRCSEFNEEVRQY